MPDNTKVIGETIAPSGAGDALFEIFKQNQDLEGYAKKKDIDTSAAMKLNTQTSEFATGMAALHHKYNLATADNAAELARREAIIKGSALNELTSKAAMEQSQQTGQAIPGLTTQGPSNTPMQGPILGLEMPKAGNPASESGYEGNAIMPGGELQHTPGTFSPNAINPLASGEAAKLMESAFSSELRKAEAKNQISYQSERDAMRDKLGLITEAHSRAAANLKATLENIDPTNVNIPLLDTFLTPGQAHQADFSRTVPQIAMQVEKAKANLNQMQALEAARLERMREVTGMRTASAEAIAKIKQGGAAASKAMGDLRKLQAGFNNHYSVLNSQAQRLSKSIDAGQMSGAEERAARTQLAQLESAITQVQGDIQRVNGAMEQQVTQANPNPPSQSEINAQQKIIEANVLKQMGVKDYASEKDDKKAEIQAEAKRQYLDWYKKKTTPINTAEPIK